MPVQLDIAGNFAKGQRVRENRQFERAMDYELDKEELERRGAWRSRQDASRKMGRETEGYEDVHATNENWLQRFARAFGGRQRSRAAPLNPAGFGDASVDEAAIAGREAAAEQLAPAPAVGPSGPGEEGYALEDDAFLQDGGFVGQRGRAIPLTSPSANVFKAGGQVNRYGGNVNAPYQDGGYVPPPSNISARLGHRGRGYQAGGPVVPGMSGGMMPQRAALSGPPGLTPEEEPQLGGGFPNSQGPGFRQTPGFQDGGLHAIHPGREKNNSPYIPAGPPIPEMGQRGQRTAIASAGVVPQEYQDGGLAYSPGRATPAPGYQAGGAVEAELAARNLSNRAAYETARAERAMSPSQIAERNAPRPGRLRRGAQAVRRAVGSGKVGGALGGAAALGTIIETNPWEEVGGEFGSGYTPTEEYRERMGLQPSQREGIPRLLEDVAIRGAGVLGDIGNRLTGGLAGRAGEAINAYEPPATAVPAEVEAPVTVEDEIARVATDKGIEQAAEAEVQNAPPGDFDFSKSDIQLHEIPQMTVNDWMNYRSEAVIGLMEQGMTGQEAHESVNLEQQQGTLNYLAQAQQSLAVGDRRSASLALYAAYQHFPNGTSLKFGTATSPETGEQMLLATGIDQETGDPIGQPTAITQESLAALRANIEDPKNFLSWTKDWRDEAFQRQIYEEVEKPAAESRAQYERDVGAGNLLRGQADVLYQQSRARGGRGGRSEADEDRANTAFLKATEELAFNNPADARALVSVMSQLFVTQGKEYTQIHQEIMDAYEDIDGTGVSGLDGVANYLEQYE